MPQIPKYDRPVHPTDKPTHSDPKGDAPQYENDRSANPKPSVFPSTPTGPADTGDPARRPERATQPTRRESGK